jgi:hypothetical protein
MVLPVTLLLFAVATWLAVDRGQRLAPWLLGAGAGIVGALWLMGRLRIPWPDFGLWTVFVLNPYLLVTLGFALLVGGGVGVVVCLVRGALGRGSHAK